MADIKEIQDEIIEEFTGFDDWLDRYQLLIDLGNEQEPLPEEYKTDNNLIEGCQSRVWLQADVVDGKISNLSPNSYTIEVTDNNGCKNDVGALLINPSIALSAGSLAPISSLKVENAFAKTVILHMSWEMRIDDIRTC